MLTVIFRLSLRLCECLECPKGGEKAEKKGEKSQKGLGFRLNRKE